MSQCNNWRLGRRRGQTAIEYLSYFAFFLLITAIFTAFVFSQSSEELNKRSQERFRSTIFYVAQGIRDADNLAQHADYMRMNITLPVITKGGDITIEGDRQQGLIKGNTTISNSNVYYYMQVGRLIALTDISQPKGENYVTVESE